jgi:hypothetical protein
MFYFLSDALDFGAVSHDTSLQFLHASGPFSWIKLDKAQVMTLSVFERCAPLPAASVRMLPLLAPATRRWLAFFAMTVSGSWLGGPVAELRSVWGVGTSSRCTGL